MLEKNGIYEAIICDYTAEGQGIAKIEGCAVFVPNAIRGEKCRVRIEKVGKTWAAGKITEILESEGEIIEGTPKTRTSYPNAWVNIMYGCNNFSV
jgi:23S rRNA (uracil1939-C5)-methyltransferase